MLYCFFTLMGTIPNGFVPVTSSATHLGGADSLSGTPTRKFAMELLFQLVSKRCWISRYGKPDGTFCRNCWHLLVRALNVLLKLNLGMRIVSMFSRHFYASKHPIWSRKNTAGDTLTLSRAGLLRSLTSKSTPLPVEMVRRS